MNCVAVEELALSQLLYLIKAKFETLFRICSEVWLIRTAYPCWIFLASTSALSSRNQVAMFMHHGFHRFCIAVVPPCGIVNASNPNPNPTTMHRTHLKTQIQQLVLLRHKLLCKSPPHSSPTIAMPILQSPPPVIINVVAAQPVQTHLRKRHASLPPDVPVPGAEARACGRS